MNFLAAWGRLAILLVLCLMAGCFPPGNSGLDEQKDPHFLTGQDRVNKLDFKGAIESFEKALETNPKSASAHFELGLLYEQREPNPARAIFHFERFLELRPASDRADIVKQRIGGCKQELAKTVTIVPGPTQQQRDLERYKLEVERLTVENAQLRQRFEAAAVARAQPTPAPQVQAPPQPRAAQPAPAPPVTRASTTTTTPAPRTTTTTPGPRITPLPPASRAHVIKPGETPSAIAKMYGVRLEKLMAANPSLDPRKLRPGQTLTIPAP
jgi:LysM repeat protein